MFFFRVGPPCSCCFVFLGLFPWQPQVPQIPVHLTAGAVKRGFSFHLRTASIFLRAPASQGTCAVFSPLPAGHVPPHILLLWQPSAPLSKHRKPWRAWNVSTTAGKGLVAETSLLGSGSTIMAVVSATHKYLACRMTFSFQRLSRKLK